MLKHQTRPNPNTEQPDVHGYHRTYHDRFPPSIPPGHVSAPVVGATITALDPVFGAIERHKAVEIEYCEASHLTDEVAAQQEGREITDYDATVMDHAAQASRLATNEFLDTVPQSKAGCRAAIAHFATVDSCEEYTLQFLRSLLKSPALTG